MNGNDDQTFKSQLNVDTVILYCRFQFELIQHLAKLKNDLEKINNYIFILPFTDANRTGYKCERSNLQAENSNKFLGFKPTWHAGCLKKNPTKLFFSNFHRLGTLRAYRQRATIPAILSTFAEMRNEKSGINFF